MTTGRLKISWEEFHSDTKDLARKIEKLNKKWEGIIAITRGGTIPAGILASELNIKIIETIGVSSYKGQNRVEMTVIKESNADIIKDGDNWLVVDDLVDKGNTSKKIRELLPKALIATVYAKPEGRPATDIFAKEFAQDTWLDFPWEIDEE